MSSPIRLIIILLVLLCIGAAHAASITVTTTADEFGTNASACSLREAVQAANTNAAFGGCPAGDSTGFDVVVLPTGRYRLTLGGLDEDANAGGDLDVTSSIIIISQDGAALTTIESGGNHDRLFDLRTSTAGLYLLDVSLRGGDVAGAAAPDGGVIRRSAGDLRLIRCAVSAGIARHGGGIYSNGNGEVQIIQSTIFANTATGVGGGLYAASNIETLLSNATISGNYAASGGGGISTTGNLRLSSCTIAFNRNGSGGGGGGMAYTGTSANADTVVFYNTIFSDNSDSAGGSNSDISCLGTTLHGGGFNLIQRSTCPLAQPNGSFTGDAKLSPLFDFGGGVPTHALLAGSDALDAGAPDTSGAACPDGDERGVVRPANACDVGAYEQAYDFTVNTTADVVDANVGDGLCRTAANQCSLRAAIQEATRSGGRHMVRLPAGDYAINLGGSNDDGGDLDIAPATAHSERQIALFGAGAKSTRIVGSGVDRIFDIHGDYSGSDEYPTAVALSGLTIAGGHVDANTTEPYGGGIHLSNADLLLVDAIVSGNSIDSGDGAGLAVVDAHSVAEIQGRVVLERVAVIDNRVDIASSSSYHGGGAFVRDGALYADNSMFSHNHAPSGGGVAASDYQTVVTLTHTTIAANRAKSQGGGLRFSDATVQVKNSVIADNHFEPGYNGTGPDCFAVLDHPVVGLGHDVIGDDSGCALGGDVSTNLVNVDARLTPLVRSANPLPIHYLYAGSPALDLVPSSQCADAGLLRVWHDQNYALRPAAGGNACDAGASEGVSDILFIDGFDED